MVVAFLRRLTARSLRIGAQCFSPVGRLLFIFRLTIWIEYRKGRLISGVSSTLVLYSHISSPLGRRSGKRLRASGTNLTLYGL